MRCTQTPGCTGAADADGYCDECGMKMSAETTALPHPSSPAPATSVTTSRATRSFGPTLVTLPLVAPPDPLSVVLSDPKVAEDQRFCANPDCGAPVGRSRGEVPGRTEGYCPRCGEPFSFVPRLRGGDLVGGQYEIAGCLAHGGLGWVYLARDRNVDDVWRVLKGVLHHGDAQAIANAIDERRFLATVNHPNIVKIINFVQHDGAGYIVMEYVDGVSLRQLVRDRRPDGLPVAHAISYMLEILPALGHLHEQGLLYCDFKPENVMCTATSVKLIDLGGVYRTDDRSSPVYGTPGYQAPEIAETGPTVASDLFTVARTLAVLCTTFSGFQTTYRYALPPPEEVPHLARHDGLYRLLRRATAPDPAQRFESAAEMADQLRGVLREIVAEETGEPAPGTSAYFTGKVRGRLDGPDWHGLPVPLVNLDDPAAAYLATVGTYDAQALVDALNAAPQRTIEVDRQLVRAQLAVGAAAEVPAVLGELEREDPHDWRTHWYTGLFHLATGDPETAHDRFRTIYEYLPGELAPKLAMAMALELGGDPARAARWYECVSRTDTSFTAAAFGLARCRIAIGDLAGASEAYQRVPDTSGSYSDAQIATARLRLAHGAELSDVTDAGRTIEALPLDPARRAALTAEVLATALLLVAGRPSAAGAPEVLGHELTETGVRLGLERAYRSLARYAASAADRIDLVDRANRVRPRTIT
jgi:serine/threonine-protein kinase PknG